MDATENPDLEAAQAEVVPLATFKCPVEGCKSEFAFKKALERHEKQSKRCARLRNPDREERRARSFVDGSLLRPLTEKPEISTA